jgi:hypothetical protein
MQERRDFLRTVTKGTIGAIVASAISAPLLGKANHEVSRVKR